MAPAGRAEWKRVAGGLLNLVFPPRCASCGDFGALLCTECRDRLEPLDEPRCPRCGRPGVAVSTGGWCADCVDRDLRFTAAHSAFLYAGVARNVVAALKYGGERGLAGVMAEEALPEFGRLAAELPAPVVTWVPSHASTRRVRGFNQAELLARALVERGDDGLQAHELIHKARGTQHQQTLSREERRENLAGSFAVADPRPASRHGLQAMAGSIILVDDVYTTGATASEVSEVAARAWGLPVHVFTFARAMHKVGDFRD